VKQRAGITYPSLLEIVAQIGFELFVRPVQLLASAVSLILFALMLITCIPLGYINAWLHGSSQLAWYQIFSRIFRVHGFLAGITIEPRGLKQLPLGDQPVVLVANHVSYLDWFVIQYALGERFMNLFALPSQVMPWPFSFWLKKMRGSVSAKSRIQLFFPELNSKHEINVIRAAITERAVLVPVTIAGANRVLFAGTWLPRPGGIRVIFQPPVTLPVNQDSANDLELIRILVDQVFCVIARDIPVHELSPRMVCACRDNLELHPVTRAAVGAKQKPRLQTGKRG